MPPETKLEDIFPRLNKKQFSALKRLNLHTANDLLHHFPNRYSKQANQQLVKQSSLGEKITLYGRFSNLKTKKAWVKKIPMSEARFEDSSGSIQVVWFNQPYLAKILNEKDSFKLTGKISQRGNKQYIANPLVEKVEKIPTGFKDTIFSEENIGGNPLPIYPESGGISSQWIYFALERVMRKEILNQIKDPIPREILRKYNLPKLETALVWIHRPKTEKDFLVAKKRFAFEEIFLIQLHNAGERERHKREKAFLIEPGKKDVDSFTQRFPFTLTKSQKESINQILSDFKKGYPMMRLLEGDVGSGKTVVAATTAWSTVTTRPKGQDFGNLQVSYMAPTEILAKQQFEEFTQYFSHLPIQIGLITSSGCQKFPSKTNPDIATKISKAQLLKWVKNGEIAILIGTHSLIQKTVQFKHLAYTIIDEQHRFGAMQRKKLMKDGHFSAHLLSMTATPIPRTLALTIYGDLDLSVMEDMPKGRKPVITEIVKPEERNDAYRRIETELKRGRQAYIICPRIEEPDPRKESAVMAKSVKQEAKRLKKEVFSGYEIGILHSKMTALEKEKVMNDFSQKKIDILVSTSVVEVGVNVANATSILIEGAERFGLAQLHQLRGRVLRSTHQAYCFIFSDSKTKKTLERLEALKTAKNGFQLAEFDMKLRGIGDIYGRKQWGISDITMEAIQNIKMVEIAKEEAKKIVENDLELKKYPLLKKQIEQKQKAIHLE